MAICVVIPAYKCKKHILSVIQKMPSFVDKVYVIDDACPEMTGQFVLQNLNDKKVEVLFNRQNGGVGAAVKAGYLKALENNYDIIVKVDGDDQMDLSLMHKLIQPLEKDKADYTKGNRFYYPKSMARMPKIRIFGNAVLGFLTKISSGYYSVFDPTNGYTAVHIETLKQLELEKLHNRYFFESDLLFRLNLSRARVLDIPMLPIYGTEKSNLNELLIIPTFLKGHFKNFHKRIVYNYFLRDFSIGSLFLIFGVALFGFGFIWSLYFWAKAISSHLPTPNGTVMIGVLTLVLGFQLILSFIMSDIAAEPKAGGRSV